MKIKDELAKLVTKYHQENMSREKLETEFEKIINNALKENGNNQTAIETTFRKLAPIFHSDTITHCDAIIFLEHTLGNYSATEKPFSKGACFKIYSQCKDTLLNPKDYTFQMFKDFCISGKATATSFIQSQFYENCIVMLNQIQQYHHAVDLEQCRPFANFSQKMFPFMVTSSLGALFMQEMFAFYGMCFLYNRLGQIMQNNTTNRACQFFGQSIATVSGQVMMSTATCFIKIHTLTTAMCNNNLTEVIAQFEYVKSTVQQMLPFRMIKSLLPYSEKKSILALTSYEFRSPNLEKIVQPLKGYLIETDKQCLKSLRCGQQKSDAVKDFFYDLMVLESQESLKPKTIWDLLNNLALTEVIQHKGEVQNALLACRELFFSYYQLQPALEEPSMNNGAYSCN